MGEVISFQSETVRRNALRENNDAHTATQEPQPLAALQRCVDTACVLVRSAQTLDELDAALSKLSRALTLVLQLK